MLDSLFDRVPFAELGLEPFELHRGKPSQTERLNVILKSTRGRHPSGGSVRLREITFLFEIRHNVTNRRCAERVLPHSRDRRRSDRLARGYVRFDDFMQHLAVTRGHCYKSSTYDCKRPTLGQVNSAGILGWYNKRNS